jgi:hypothetical protein
MYKQLFNTHVILYTMGRYNIQNVHECLIHF